MGFEITDGTGRGNSAAVDATNRVLTRSVSEDIFQNAAEESEAYFLGTPLINLTGSSESALYIITNNEDSPLVLGNFFFVAESTSGGTPNMFRVSWYKNPTSISGGATVAPLNQNFGSSKTLNANAQYGAEGSTITGGSNVATLSFPIGQFNDIPANLILEKGSSFAITVTPPAGNTSMDVQFGSRAIRYVKYY